MKEIMVVLIDYTDSAYYDNYNLSKITEAFEQITDEAFTELSNAIYDANRRVTKDGKMYRIIEKVPVEEVFKSAEEFIIAEQSLKKKEEAKKALEKEKKLAKDLERKKKQLEKLQKELNQHKA